MRNAIIFISMCILLCALPSHALEVGEVVEDVKLRDGKTNTEVGLPDLGEKVVTLFYTDADVADLNDPLADAMQKRSFSAALHRSYGIVNLEESKAPNFIIAAIVKGKIEKYSTTILTDARRLLPRSWRVEHTNNSSIVIVIGKDRRVRYFKNGAVRGADIDTVLGVIEAATKDADVHVP